MPGGYFLAGRTSQKPEKGQSIFGEPRLAVVQLPRIPIPRTRLHKDLAHGAPQPPRLLYVSSFVRRGSAFHEGLVLVGCHSSTPTTCRCL
jgi:hypothetical protein